MFAHHTWNMSITSLCTVAAFNSYKAKYVKTTWGKTWRSCVHRFAPCRFSVNSSCVCVRVCNKFVNFRECTGGLNPADEVLISIQCVGVFCICLSCSFRSTCTSVGFIWKHPLSLQFVSTHQIETEATFSETHCGVFTVSVFLMNRFAIMYFSMQQKENAALGEDMCHCEWD